MNNLVSIIIPTYNRAHLIGETLDSIFAQTYTNWECIVVDDGSTDNTETLLKSYIQKDSRFQFFKRPKNRLKGANACRNYGFEVCKGAYINWFDSDDIMYPEFIQYSLTEILKENKDYVISKTEDFDPDIDEKPFGVEHKHYRFDEFEWNHFNYVTQRINWITQDLLIKKDVAYFIKFDERLASGQEYNFNCKLTAKTINGVFLNKITSKRRIHNESIQGFLKINKTKMLLDRFLVAFITWQDLEDMDLKHTLDSRYYLFSSTIRDSLIIEVPIRNKHLFSLFIGLSKYCNFKTALLYILYQFIGRLTGKGHFVRKLFLDKWEPSEVNTFNIVNYNIKKDKF
ncbi:glycosyltransferase family 2 protein [Yeosuana sp. AK3]